jgi:hypothetical protein
VIVAGLDLCLQVFSAVALSGALGLSITATIFIRFKLACVCISQKRPRFFCEFGFFLKPESSLIL